MLVLKNGNGVMADSGQLLGNNGVNALRVENTNTFKFSIATTGPIRISWGDGTYVDLAVQSSSFEVAKNYSTVGNYIISISNQLYLKQLSFNNSIASKINAPASWLSQFCYLEILECPYHAFVGDLSLIIDISLPKLNRLVYTATTSLSKFNVSNCKRFISKATVLSLGGTGISGKLSDVNINYHASYISIYGDFEIGDISGIIKNGCTKLTTLAIYPTRSGMTLPYAFDNWEIPDSLSTLNIRGLTSNSIINFNFKNLSSINIANCNLIIDLSNNTSFETIAKKAINLFISYIDGRLTVPLSKCTGQFVGIGLFTNSTNNYSYGDASSAINNSSGNICIDGALKDNNIYGNLSATNRFTTGWFWLKRTNLTSDEVATRTFLSKANLVNLQYLPNFTGDISGASFTKISNPYIGIFICNMDNLFANIVSFSYGTWYYSLYTSVELSYNPHFTGNLGDLTLWANKSIINLSYCGYTDVPRFIRKIFTNRNVCLKAAGGMTTIAVQGNIDNPSLTGSYQQPNLGTYRGTPNNLTEAQIDNLATGFDHTGTGTNTPWTDKEKIWFMENCKNSSTDNSLRYRVIINY